MKIYLYEIFCGITSVESEIPEFLFTFFQYYFVKSEKSIGKFDLLFFVLPPCFA